MLGNDQEEICPEINENNTTKSTYQRHVPLEFRGGPAFGDGLNARSRTSACKEEAFSSHVNSLIFVIWAPLHMHVIRPYAIM